MPTVPYNTENNDDKLVQTENVGRIKSFITEGIQNEFGNNRTQSQNESVNRIQNFIRSGFNEDDIKLTYNLGLKKSKSEAADGLNNRGLDIPQTLSADERKELLSRQKLEDLNPEQLRMIAPSFSRWVEGDIERAALTQDDIKQLSYIEKHWEFIREQYTVGDLTTELSNLGAKDALLGLDENERKRRDEIKQRMAQSGDFGFSLGEDTIGFMANQLPIFRESLMGKVQAAAVGGAAGGVAAATGALIAGQLGPQAATPEEVVTVPGAFLAGAKPGAVAGWRYGAMIAAAKMEFGLAYDEFKDIKIDEFNTIDKPTAVGAAAAVGMINGALEGFGFEQLAKRIPGLSKLSRGGVKKLMKTPGVRQALTGYFKIVGQAMATEGSTEFLQEMTKDVAGGLVEIMNSDSKSDMSTGEILSKLFSSENLAKWKEAGIRGAQVGGGITATTNAAYYGGKGAVRQVNKAMKARADAKALENMENAIAETDLKRMSPKESGNYLKQVASDNGIEKVYVPVEKFEALFQSKVDKNGNPIKPEDAASSIGVDLNTYNEALQNGGDIAIPIEQWGEKVLGTDISKSLVGDVRLKPEGMTSNEAVEYFSERDQVELEKQQAAQLEETEQLKVNIKDRMIKVGFRGNVAESYADVFSEFYSTLAQRKGITVNEAWETYGFNISNEAVEKVDADNVLFQGGHDRLKRAMNLGYDTDTTYYHGTKADIKEFSKNKLGLSTGTRESAKAFFFSDNPDVANLFAYIAPTKARQEYDRLSALYEEKFESGVSESSPEMVELLAKVNAASEAVGLQKGRGKLTDEEAAVYPVYLKMENPLEIDMEGKEFGEGDKLEIEDYIDRAKREGHDSVVFRNAYDTPGQGTKRNISTITAVFNENQVRSTFAQFNDSDSANILAQDDRGRLTFNGVEMNIELLKNPDLSTVMHEAGHVFVEVLAKIDQEQDAPQQIKDDFKTLIEWAGFESVDKWHESDLNTRREAHEKIADGFLNYLKEGKAPSSALRQAFNRMKDWLGHLFRTGQFRDIELNKDVRAVFDRMLSTDEEIEAAKAENNILSLFQNPEQFGLTGKAGKEFVQKLQEATLNARETMHAKVVDEYNKKVSQGSKLLKETIRQEILESLNNNPIYSALTILGTGKLPDGTILDKPMKLSKKALVAIYGKDILKKMRKPYLYADDTGKNVRKNVNIVHPDTAAQALGFGSAEQMFDQIFNAKPMDEFVEQQVEARFEQESGVLLTNEEIEQTANEVVNGEKNSEIMQMELELLASDKFAAGVGLAEKIARKVPSIAVIKERARDVISQRKFRDIKPREFLSNVSKANKEAFRALKNKDFAAAFDARARALYNQELYNEAVRVREYTEKKLRYVRKFKKDSKRRQIGKYDPEALEQIDDILSRYRLDKTLSMIKVDKTKTLVEYMAKLANLGYPQSALDQKVLDDARKIDYRDMTIEEFRGLIGTMEYIDNAAIQANKLLTEQSKLTLEQTVEGITSSIYANFTGGKANRAGVETLKSKVTSFVKKYGAEHIKVDTLVDLLDGGEYNGPVGKAIWNVIANARNMKYKIQQRLSDGLRVGVFEKIYTPKELANLSKTVYVASANNGTHKGTFTIADIMTLALNMGTAEGQQRVANFGFSDSTMEEIFSHLTKKDLDAIQAIWIYLDNMWPEIAQHEQDINGIKPEKVKAKRVTINGREMTGGYYPLKYDSDTNERQKQLDDKTTIQEAFGQSYTHAMTKQGHLNTRLEQVDKTIRLGFEVLGGHLDDVAHDLAFRKPVMDVARIIDNRQFQAAVVDAVGNDLYRQFKSWIVDVANDNTGAISQNARFIDKFARVAKDAAAVVNMGLKLTTAIVQPLGYLQTIDTIGKKWAMHGLRETYSNPIKILKMYKEISALSPMMANRISNYNRDVNEFMRRTKIIGATPGKVGSISHKYRQLSETYFYGIAAMDIAVAIPTWKGAYEQAMAGEAKNVTKGDMDQAIAYADAMVERSQGSGDVKNLAAIQRGSPVQKLFTMYYSYFSINLQRMIRAGFSLIKTKDIPQFISSMFLLQFAPFLMETLILGRHPDEGEDEKEWYKYFGKMALYPLNGIVGVRELGNVLDGYGASSSATSDYFYSIGAGVGSAAKLGAGVFSDDIEIKRSDYKNIVMGSAYAFRLPGRQMWLTGEYMVDWINGENNPENLPIGLWEMTVTGKKRK